jgi:hypothetical protein
MVAAHGEPQSIDPRDRVECRLPLLSQICFWDFEATTYKRSEEFSHGLEPLRYSHPDPLPESPAQTPADE